MTSPLAKGGRGDFPRKRDSGEQKTLLPCKPCLGMTGPVEKVRQRRSRVFVGLRAHRLGALRAVRPHALRVRSGCQSPLLVVPSFGKSQDRTGRAFLNRPLACDDSGNWSDGIGALKILNYSTGPSLTKRGTGRFSPVRLVSRRRTGGTRPGLKSPLTPLF